MANEVDTRAHRLPWGSLHPLVEVYPGKQGCSLGWLKNRPQQALILMILIAARLWSIPWNPRRLIGVFLSHRFASLSSSIKVREAEFDAGSGS